MKLAWQQALQGLEVLRCVSHDDAAQIRETLPQRSPEEQDLFGRMMAVALFAQVRARAAPGLLLQAPPALLAAAAETFRRSMDELGPEALADALPALEGVLAADWPRFVDWLRAVQESRC